MTLIAAIRRSPVLVWAVLVAATLISWILPGAPGSGGGTALAILIVAGAKSAIIGLEFMELRWAHWGLGAALLVWCLALTAVLCGLFLL